MQKPSLKRQSLRCLNHGKDGQMNQFHWIQTVGDGNVGIFEAQGLNQYKEPGSMFLHSALKLPKIPVVGNSVLKLKPCQAVIVSASDWQDSQSCASVRKYWLESYHSQSRLMVISAAVYVTSQAFMVILPPGPQLSDQRSSHIVPRNSCLNHLIVQFLPLFCAYFLREGKCIKASKH
jgi:hypothetical protein